MDSVQLHRLLANGKVLCFKRCRERALGVKRGIYYGRDKKKRKKKKNIIAKMAWLRGLNTKRGTGGIAGFRIASRTSAPIVPF